MRLYRLIYLLTFAFTRVVHVQEVNPSLADETSVQQTVAVGCSLLRSALGMSSPRLTSIFLDSYTFSGETLL